MTRAKSPPSGLRATAALLLATTCWTAAPGVRAADAPLSAESYMVVDCLLPGQVRKLGRATTFLTPRRPMRTSAINCEIRGGEYVAADRATMQSSLAVWLPTAQGGDAKAQAYVGHIYADGFGQPPDYAQAAAWLQKAVDQGYSPAMIELGQLYERGQGVPQDAAKAVALYRQATGLPPSNFAADTDTVRKLNAKYEAARSETQGVSRELEATRAELEKERAALAAARAQIQQATVSPTKAGAASADLAAAQKALADKTAQLDAANARSAELSAQLAQAKASADKSAPMAARLKAAEADRARMEQELAQLRAQAPTQQGRVSFLEADAAQARKFAADANTRLADANTALAAREKELAAAKTRLAAEQAKATAGDTQAQARLKTTQADYDRMTAERDQAQAAAAARQAEIAAANEALKSREADLAQAKAAAAAAQAQLEKTQSLLASSQAQLSGAQTRTAQVQQDLDAASKRSADLAAQVASLKQEVASARAAGGTASKALAQRETELAQREARVKDLETRLASATRNAPQSIASRGVQPPRRMPASSKFGFNQSFAVLIGESDYRDPKLPKLATPTNDVTQLAGLLKSRYGFITTVLIDKSRADILRELDDLSQKLTENDTLVIYYAGHGGMEKVRNGADRGYWLPVDAEFGRSAGEISNQEITYQVARMAARKVLIIADSCYSGLLTQTVTRAQRPVAADENTNDYLIGMAHKQSRNVLTSGRLEPVLDGGGKGNHSVFASALLEVLRANNDVITSEEIYSRVVTRVMSTATSALLKDEDLPDPQQPTYSALENGGHVYGDFLFVPTAAAVAANTPARVSVASSAGR